MLSIVKITKNINTLQHTEKSFLGGGGGTASLTSSLLVFELLLDNFFYNFYQYTNEFNINKAK